MRVSLYSNSVSLSLRLFDLSLLYRISCWPIIQKVHYHPCMHGIKDSNCMSAKDFRIFSEHSAAFHLSLTVLVHYHSDEIIRLWRWSSSIQTQFLVLCPTRVYKQTKNTGLSPSTAELPSSFFFMTPQKGPGVWIQGLIRFRSPLLTESRLISVPLVTKMFQFTRFCPMSNMERSFGAGFPLGNLKITAYNANFSLSQYATSFFHQVRHPSFAFCN